MKRTCRYFFLLYLFGLLCCIINAQLPWEYTVKQGMWDYPVKPGTEEWKQSQSYEEKIKSCQIPEEVLTSLSTDDLTELCLRYPLLIDLFAFENINVGFNKMFSEFNGIRELYLRDGVLKNLKKKYDEKI